MKYLKILSLSVLLILAFSTILNAKKIDYPTGLSQALMHNFSIKLVKKNKDIADANNTLGNAGFLPTVDVNAGYLYSSNNVNLEFLNGTTQEVENAVTTQTNASVSLNWTLFDGFAMFANYDKLAKLQERSQIELQLEIEQVVRQYTLAYYNSAKLSQTLNILAKAIEQSKSRLERLELRSQYGQAMNLEVLQAKVSINSDSSNYLQTLLALKNSNRQIKFIIGDINDEELEVEVNENIQNIEDVSKLRLTMLERNSSLAFQLKNREISEEDKRLVLSTYFPRVTANGGWSFLRSEAEAGFVLSNQTTGFSGGVNLSYNLFNAGRDDIRSQLAQINLEMMDISIDQLKANLDFSLINAVDNYTMRKSIYQLELSNRSSALENFEKSKIQYEFGQISSIEFRDAQVNLINIENRINESLFDAIAAKVEIDLLVGQLFK